MRHLSGHFQMMTLDNAADYLRGGFELSGDAIVVTFDDGYQDNFTEALPVLTRYGVCACFFVSSAPMLDGGHYWIDELSALLDALHGTNTSVNLADLPQVGSEISAFIAAPVQDKPAQAKVVFLALNRLNEQQKYTVLEALRVACDDAGCVPGNTPALITAEQLEIMAHVGQQIGAHTVTHPRLSNLAPEEVLSEITRGLVQLRQCVGEVRHFAYPFGKLADIPSDHSTLFAALEAARVTLAMTTEDGVVTRGDCRYLVPRTVMSPQSLAETRLKLERLAWKR